MRVLRQNVRSLVLIGVITMALCVPSFAGSQTGYTGTIAAGGFDFTATLIVNNAGFNPTTGVCTASECSYMFTFTGLNTNLTMATINEFAMQLFGNGSNASFDLSGGYSIPSGWTAQAGAKIDNGGLGCNSGGGGVGGWLCGSALMASDTLKVGSGQKFSMTFNGNFAQGTSIISAFDLMANGLKNVNNSDSKWSVSQGFQWTQFTPVSEPGSLAMLGSGLLSAACLLRKKFLL